MSVGVKDEQGTPSNPNNLVNGNIAHSDRPTSIGTALYDVVAATCLIRHRLRDMELVTTGAPDDEAEVF